MPFNRPTLQQLIDRAQADIETRLPGTDARLRRSNLNVLSRVHSGGMHGLYGFLHWLSRQFLPDTAESENLDRIATLWLAEGRKPAAPAAGPILFTGNNGAVIPAGTLLQRSDGAEYATDAEVTIADGEADAQVTAVQGGTEGNTEAGSALTLVSPIAGVQSQATVGGAGLTNGIDIESDDALRERVIARMQQPPHGGASFDYIMWALAVPGITRAWVFPLGLGEGTVLVYVVTDDADPIIPDGTKIQEVQDYIDERRPVTADVTVVAPTAVALDFEIEDLEPDELSVRDAVEASLRDLIRRTAEPGGTILISHIREAISIAAGEHDHVLVDPVANVDHSDGEIAVMGNITWSTS